MDLVLGGLVRSDDKINSSVVKLTIQISFANSLIVQLATGKQASIYVRKNSNDQHQQGTCLRSRHSVEKKKKTSLALCRI